jgi:hypothetical protein
MKLTFSEKLFMDGVGCPSCRFRPVSLPQGVWIDARLCPWREGKPWPLSAGDLVLASGLG